MYEIEVKLPLRSEPIEPALKNLGFRLLYKIREEDHYFDSEDSRIRNGGEALRIRSIINPESHSSKAVITYKGKLLDGAAKSRKELEVSVGDGNVAAQILEAIGYHPVSPSVIKTREEYSRDNMHACIDHVEGLGDFLELEIVVADEQNKECAIEKIRTVLHTLGYSMEDTTRNSYLGLLQKAVYE